MRQRIRYSHFHRSRAQRHMQSTMITIRVSLPIRIVNSVVENR